jgi:hypothetical protein
MTDHARKWLESWVIANVTAAPFLQQKRLATETFGPTCFVEASRTGITRRELEAAAGGDLIVFLESAIEDKTDIEVRKNRPPEWN